VPGPARIPEPPNCILGRGAESRSVQAAVDRPVKSEHTSVWIPSSLHDAALNGVACRKKAAECAEGPGGGGRRAECAVPRTRRRAHARGVRGAKC